MTSKNNKLETSKLVVEATDSNGNRLPIVGMAMAWSYSKSEYDQDKVIDAFRVNNLDTKHIETGAERIDAVKRAVKKAKDKNLLREISPGKYQLTEETLNEMAGVLEYSMKEIIEYDDDNEEFLFIDENGNRRHDKQRSDELMKRVRHQECVFRNNDVTRYTKELFKNKGIVSLRSSGGLYFVPSKFASLVTDVRNAFNLLDPQGMFMLIEIPDTPNAAQSIAVSSLDMVKGKLEMMKVAIEKHKAERAKKRADGTLKKGKFEGDISGSKAETQLEEIAAVAGDVELLAECLGFELEDCNKVLKEYKESLLAELGVESEEKFISDRQAKRDKRAKKPEAEDTSLNPTDTKPVDDIELGEVEESSNPTDVKHSDDEVLSSPTQGELLFN